MEELSKYASLERYILTRGRILLSPSPSLKGLNIQFGIGVGLIAISTIMWVSGAMASIPGLVFGAIGPMLAGLINAAVALALKRKFGQSPQPATNLSRESRAMLARLGWTYIWSKNPWVWSMYVPEIDYGQTCQRDYGAGAHFHHYNHHAWRHAMTHRSSAEIPAEVLEQMDQAASHFNRTVGALEAAGSAGTVQRLRPKILQAADEAMIDVLHQAQLASQFPESIKSIQGRLSADLARLSEIGDRVEALTLREPTFTDMLAQRTTADEVLEELRLEQSAFNELSTQEDDSPRNNLQA